MVEEENGVETSIVKVSHVTVVTSDGVDGIVKRLETVGARGGGRDPGLVTKLGKIAVLEEVVETVGKTDSVVGDFWSDQPVLTGGVAVPAGWVALGHTPRGELRG